jgi:hypothetical protein
MCQMAMCTIAHTAIIQVRIYAQYCIYDTLLDNILCTNTVLFFKLDTQDKEAHQDFVNKTGEY